MSEETQFWGVGTPNAFRDSPLMLWRNESSPGSNVYPVFDSKRGAEDFVRAAYVRGTGDIDIGSPALLETLKTIRRVKRDEIPPGQNVWYDRKGLVTWGELLEEGG
jgi:hypothetical protein